MWAPIDVCRRAVQALWRDLLDQGASPRAEPAPGRIGLTSVAGIASGLIVPFVTFLNSFTTDFAGATDFRLRNGLALVLLGCSTALALRILTNKGSEPNELRHRYAYSSTERVTAKLMLLPLIFGIVITTADVRYWIGSSNSIEGRVLGQDGHPVAAAVVDALNLDKESVAVNGTLTDDRGIFVLDLAPRRGRAAFLEIISSSPPCQLVQRIPSQLMASTGGVNDRKVSDIVFSCQHP